MRERQRWQPEEDALLREYVKRYGAKEWALLPERMGRPLHRDPKSCHERWKNYLRPGLKKGSLSPDEQSLLISLQARYGNKWKAIAAHLPGRTPKRLGKWWEVFKEKQLKLSQSLSPASTPVAASPSPSPSPSAYEHILQTFAEKHSLLSPAAYSVLSPAAYSVLSSVPATVSPAPAPQLPLPPPSVTLSLSPPRAPAELSPPELPALERMCAEVEEARRAWAQHRKEAAWRLSRLEQQMETEKARKKREKAEEVEASVRRLREEERAWVERAEAEWRVRIARARAEAEAEEAKVAEVWEGKQAKLGALIRRIDGGGGGGGRDDGCAYGQLFDLACNFR